MDPERFDTHAFARKLAGEMGEDWEAEIPAHDSYQEMAYVRKVVDPTCKIHICGPNRYGQKGRLTFSGSLIYEPGCGDGLGSHETKGPISVSSTKTPGQMAKDLTRRLLPLYLDQHARNQAYAAQRRAWKAQETATKNAIDAMEHVYKRTHPSVSGAVYVQMESDGATQAQLKLSHLPLDLLQQIINLLP